VVVPNRLVAVPYVLDIAIQFSFFIWIRVAPPVIGNDFRIIGYVSATFSAAHFRMRRNSGKSPASSWHRISARFRAFEPRIYRAEATTFGGPRRSSAVGESHLVGAEFREELYLSAVSLNFPLLIDRSGFILLSVTE
jgi:hypothetical protein